MPVPLVIKPDYRELKTDWLFPITFEGLLEMMIFATLVGKFGIKSCLSIHNWHLFGSISAPHNYLINSCKAHRKWMQTALAA